jgi:hypothetical protein
MENIYENEITKKMLSITRNNNLIKESTEEGLSSNELSEEHANFRNTVTPRVEFTGFKVYPETKNAVFSGKFDALDGLEWQFTLEDSDGLYLTGNNVSFSDETINTIKKLKGFYDNWAEQWSQKLATEYSVEREGDENEVQQSGLA